MIGKGFNLFTTSPTLLHNPQTYCCDVCTSPMPFICMLFCRFRIATMGEYYHELLTPKDDNVST